MTKDSYAKHINRLKESYAAALQSGVEQGQPYDAVLIAGGTEQHYFGDDRGVPFQAYGHLLHWLPVNRPDQFIYYCPGQKPVYYRVMPSDFWYAQDTHIDPAWKEQFTIVELESLEELATELGNLSSSKIAFVGERYTAELLNIDQAAINPHPVLAYLDFARAVKTDYELEQLRGANRLALLGHAAARKCFLQGGSEYEIHMAFLEATQSLEEESPYTNIVAINEKAAILHYQFKRKSSTEPNQVLLIDAGCRVNAYGSDITRTWTSEDAHPVFQSLVAAMEAMEQELVQEVEPGVAYPSIHASALSRLSKILIEHELCQGEVSQMMEAKLPHLFMPHGVGHLLGIQVHDVGGHQADQHGSVLSPPESTPALRNTRVLEEDMVFTIEPGLYFIPLLLEPERTTERGKSINWKLIDELYPLGGIRIEDNIRVTANGSENLTRQFE